MVAVGWLLSGHAALAQPSPDLIYASEPWPGAVIDFRARPSKYIGHTYIVYGRTYANGRVVEMHYAGLIPEQNVWEGIFSPIAATVRKYKDDSRLTPMAIYRRRLTAPSTGGSFARCAFSMRPNGVGT